MKRLHKIFALLLTLALLLGVIPVMAAAGDDVTVYVSISVNGQYVNAKDSGKTLVRVPLDVPAGSTEIDVLLEFHRLYHADGDDGYEYAGWFSKFWGVTTYNIGYFNNGEMVLSPSAVSGGDDIEGVVYADYMSDIYSRFTSQEMEVGAGERAELTLLGAGILDMYEEYPSAYSGAELLTGIADASGVITWSETGIATDTDGKAGLTFDNAGIYYVSAKNSAGTLLPAVCVVTVGSAMSDEQKDALIAGDKAALTLPSETNGNLTLPSTGSSGKTSISWSSSHPGIISDSGIYTLPTADTTVTLTATISLGGRSDTHIFSVTAKALTSEAAQSKLNAAKAIIEAAAFTAYEYEARPGWGNGYGDNLQDSNIIEMLQALIDADDDARGVVVGNTLTEITGGANFFVAENGDITYPTKSSGRTGTVKASLSIVHGGGTLTAEATSGTITINRKIATKAETLAEAVGGLNFDKIKSSNTSADSVKSNLSMSTSSGSYVSVSWTSSNTEVISNYGTVTRPAYGAADVQVTLTAVLSLNSYGESMPGPAVAGSETVIITVTVKAHDETEYNSAKLEIDAALDAFDPGTLTHMGGDAADLDGVLYDLQLKDIRGAITGTAYEWTSANSAIEVITLRGKVTRPALGASDVTGKLRVTLSKAGYSNYKEFDVTVKAMSQEEIDAEKAYMSAVKSALTFDVIKKSNTAPYAVTGSLQMVYRGYYDGSEFTWATSNSGESGIKIEWETGNSSVIASYAASIDAKTVTDALAEVQKTVSEAKAAGNTSAAGEIKLDVKSGKNDVKSVEVSIPAEAVTAVADAADIRLTIASDTADITLDAGVVAGLASELKTGETLTVTAEIVDTSTVLSDKQKEIAGENPVIEFSISAGDRTIDEFNGEITISIPYTPPAEFSSGDAELLTVYYLDNEGNLSEMKGARYDPASGTITFTTGHFSKFMIAEWINPFSDIKKSDWFYKSIRYAYAEGLMNGTEDKTFAPGLNLTRAMLVTILYRFEGEPAVNGQLKFSDAAQGEWYSSAILWANANGVVNGYGDGLFGTNENVTREEIAVILMRFAEQKGLSVSKTADLSKYGDNTQVSDWAQDAIKWASSAGIITGRTDMTLDPKGNAARAEVAAILMRYIENFAKKAV